MAQQLSAIAKILTVSTLGALLVKYGLSKGLGIEAIAPAVGGVIAAILLPSVLMACLLLLPRKNRDQTS